MDCPSPETLEKYVTGKVSDEQGKSIASHVKGCLTCQQQVTETQANEDLLTQLKTLSPPPSFTQAEATPAALVPSVAAAQELLDDRYRILEKATSDPGHSVFHAMDTVLDRHVAIKFLPSDTQADWQEARLMGQINHPAIAQVHEIGVAEPLRYVILEWVEGSALTEAWRNFDQKQRLLLFLQVLEGVGAAHRRGIVHRDLKPANIRVTKTHQPKILDFGIACQAAEGVPPQLYQGTPAYSAPEQISAPVHISAATDVYALGVLLYELLTDTHPFADVAAQDMFSAIESTWPTLPRALSHNIPMALQNICLKALEKVPNRRYANAEAFARDLRRFLHGERVWSRPSFLADSLQQTLFHHCQTLGVWRDNGLLTTREHDRLTGIYRRLVAPSDPSIIEARSLSLSQVCLYFGGWIVVMGSSVLFYKTWSHIPPGGRPLPAMLATAFLGITGLLLWGRYESRLGVGFLATATLLIPVTLAVTLAQWNLLEASRYPWGDETLYNVLVESQSHVLLGNLQIHLTAWAWLLSALGCQRLTRSSIFVLFAVVAFLALLTSSFLVAGLAEWEGHITAGRYLVAGLLLYITGTVFDKRKRPRFAWPLATTGLGIAILALSGLAASPATLLGWLHLPIDGFTQPERHALSVIASGIVYLLWAGLCRGLNTPLQRSYAGVLNWLGPLHLLVPLRLLDTEGLELADSHRLVYRILLPLTAIGFVFGSVTRQMKSFFFSGLGGIGFSIQKITAEHLSTAFAWPVGLIASGITFMLTACFVPRWHARRKK